MPAKLLIVISPAGFEPYFEEKDMPEFQRQQLQRWEEDAKKQQSLDFGEATAEGNLEVVAAGPREE